MVVKLYKNNNLVRVVNGVTWVQGPITSEYDKVDDMVLCLHKPKSRLGIMICWLDGYDKVLVYNPKRQVSEIVMKLGTNDMYDLGSGKTLMDLSSYNQWQTKLLAKLDILVLLEMSEDSIKTYLKENR